MSRAGASPTRPGARADGAGTCAGATLGRRVPERRTGRVRRSRRWERWAHACDRARPRRHHAPAGGCRGQCRPTPRCSAVAASTAPSTRPAGPALHAACRALRAGEYVHGLPAGEAVATTAGDLPARWVIHTVGPVFEPGEDRSDVLASCFRESLRLADELGAASVAFPAVSAGRLPLADRRGGQDRRRHRARHPDAGRRGALRPLLAAGARGVPGRARGGPDRPDRADGGADPGLQVLSGRRESTVAERGCRLPAGRMR